MQWKPISVCALEAVHQRSGSLQFLVFVGHNRLADVTTPLLAVYGQSAAPNMYRIGAARVAHQ